MTCNATVQELSIHLKYSEHLRYSGYLKYRDDQSLTCKGTRQLPVTNCKSLALFSSSKASTIAQNHLTILLSGVQCFNLVFNFQSSVSILPNPLIIS